LRTRTQCGLLAGRAGRARQQGWVARPLAAPGLCARTRKPWRKGLEWRSAGEAGYASRQTAIWRGPRRDEFGRGCSTAARREQDPRPAWRFSGSCERRGGGCERAAALGKRARALGWGSGWGTRALLEARRGAVLGWAARGCLGAQGNGLGEQRAQLAGPGELGRGRELGLRKRASWAERVGGGWATRAHLGCVWLAAPGPQKAGWGRSRRGPAREKSSWAGGRGRARGPRGRGAGRVGWAVGGAEGGLFSFCFLLFLFFYNK
jgi:hypothetical protein